MDMSFFVPTRFVWRFHGQQVYLIGSFTRWVETVPMAPADASPGVFAVVVHLPPGYHQYKFIVDGEWRHDETAPFMADPIGNVNNWVFVKRPEQLHQAPPVLVPAQQPMPPPPPMQPSDEPMADENSVPNVAISERKEPEYTRSVVHEFLHSHTAFELIPESSKVVALDMDLSVRQAFHALAEQGISSASLWDSNEGNIVGVISASDFIHALRQLRESVSSGGSALSAAEMDRHSIRDMREEMAHKCPGVKSLVYVEPDMKLQEVVQTLFSKKCSMAPIVTVDTESGQIPNVLHIATIAGILGCIMRHFRASLASLPLLAEPLGTLPLGTWSPTVDGNENTDQSARNGRTTKPLHVVHPSTPLTSALTLMLESGVSVLPVVDDSGVLLDIYARSDITNLAKGNAYSRLQYEEMTVQQALNLARPSSHVPSRPQAGAISGLTASLQGGAPSSVEGQVRAGQGQPVATSTRAHIVSRQDSLRTVVERLAVPGVRRLMVANPMTRQLEGIISLSDVASYLFL
ncbi:unnamed protein product [Ostreobium quekettii]|uniref:CBS domain-containing protein n=1 Tax=Ostreobium quekettii TaxID=121088 RepID=A0A8S1J817_9CHLO|nr:unnamed protein product [Ostreobium quekettii]|eukprot:evm.model.scf_204.11 EVM.evm.TU.scf_204.11   scf_204:51336-61189(-)